MSGIIVDRALLHLQSQSNESRPGDAFISVIFEIGASGFKVRLKSGNLKSIDPPTLLGKSKEESRVFTREEDARRYFKEQIDFLRQVGFHELAPHSERSGLEPLDTSKYTGSSFRQSPGTHHPMYRDHSNSCWRDSTVSVTWRASVGSTGERRSYNRFIVPGRQ